MGQLSKRCGAALVAFSTALGQGTLAEAEMPQNADAVSRISDIAGVTNPAGQCIAMRDLGGYPRSYLEGQIGHIAEIVSRDEIGADLVQGLNDSNSVVCMAALGESYVAKHYSANENGRPSVVVLNNAASEGCLVSAFAHEAQHDAQDKVGLTAPVKDLEQWDNQERLILAVERDAATIQTLVSWRLAQPAYTDDPYIGAMECMYTDFAEHMPYFAEATDMLGQVRSEQPEWIENGQAARQIYEVFATDGQHWMTNSVPMRSLYFQCQEDSSLECYDNLYTLDDLGIELGNLGSIHYEEDYRHMPYDDSLGPRPEPVHPLRDWQTIPRFRPLP